MNRTTIYYIKDEGTKKNIISVPTKDAEKYFKMGVAIEIDKKAWALPPDVCMAHAEAELTRFLNKQRGIRLSDVVTPTIINTSSNFGKVMGGNPAKGFDVVVVGMGGVGEIPKSIQKSQRQVAGTEESLLESLLKMNKVEDIHNAIKKALGREEGDEWYIQIMSIDPDDHYGREQGDDHQKYGMTVIAKNKKDALEKGEEQFKSDNPNLPVYWVKAFK